MFSTTGPHQHLQQLERVQPNSEIEVSHSPVGEKNITTTYVVDPESFHHETLQPVAHFQHSCLVHVSYAETVILLVCSNLMTTHIGGYQRS